jgi:DNA-binding MarR family transcriptional regulator
MRSLEYADRLIRMLMRFFTYSRFARESKAPNGELLLMSLLAGRDEPLRPSELAAELNFSTPRIAMALGILEKKGFIMRQSCPHDRRVSQVLITEEGRMHAKHKEEMGRNKLSRIFEAMGERDSEVFFDSVRKFLEVADKVCNDDE